MVLPYLFEAIFTARKRSLLIFVCPQGGLPTHNAMVQVNAPPPSLQTPDTPPPPPPGYGQPGEVHILLERILICQRFWKFYIV